MKDVLRRLINEKLQGDISQDALAEAIGISQATIHKILYTETKHTLDVLQRCADYFRVQISQFYDGELGNIGQRTAGEVNEQPSAYNKVNKYKVIAEVGEILDSGNDDIIIALVKNIQESKRAVASAKRLNICEEELKTQRKEIDALRNQVEKFTAPPTSAEGSDAS